MIGTRRTAGSVACTLLVLVVGACGSTVRSPREPGDPGSAATPAAPVPARVPGRSVGPVDFRPYDGAAARDPRVPAGLQRMALTVLPTVAAAEDRAGVTFLPGRGAVVDLVDDGVDPRGEVNVRLVDGVRRPVIRVPVRGLVAGVFLPEAHFRPLLVEAAVIASAGERVPPAWLRTGLGPEITETSERLLHERALGGPVLRTDATALFPPTPSDDDPLRAAARVRALERIARGERPLARFVTARVEGRPETEALDLVGVQDPLFLDAAAETERDRALARITAGGPTTELAAIREALEQGDPGRARDAVAAVEQALLAGGLSPWIETDARLTLAEVKVVVGDAAEARRLVAQALAAPQHLVRVREARLCQARAAQVDGDASAAARLYRAYLNDFPGAPGSAEAMQALGVSPQLAARLPGIAAQLTSDDAAERGRAAVRLGETGDPAVAEPLRRLAGDADADVRRLALAALAMTLGEQAVDDLDAGTRDADPEVRGAALSLLAFASAERGVRRARGLESDPAPEVRVVVDRVLAPVRAEEERARADAERRAAEDAAEAERREREAAEARAREMREKAAREAAERPAPVVPGTGKPKEPPVPSSDPPEEPPPVPPVPGTRRDGPLPPPRPPRPLPAPTPEPKPEPGKQP